MWIRWSAVKERTRQWPEVLVSDFVARFCALREKNSTRKRVRNTCPCVSRKCANSVTQIIYFGPLSRTRHCWTGCKIYKIFLILKAALLLKRRQYLSCSDLYYLSWALCIARNLLSEHLGFKVTERRLIRFAEVFVHFSLQSRIFFLEMLLTKLHPLPSFDMPMRLFPVNRDSGLLFDEESIYCIIPSSSDHPRLWYGVARLWCLQVAIISIHMACFYNWHYLKLYPIKPTVLVSNKRTL